MVLDVRAELNCCSKKCSTPSTQLPLLARDGRSLVLDGHSRATATRARRPLARDGRSCSTATRARRPLARRARRPLARRVSRGCDITRRGDSHWTPTVPTPAAPNLAVPTPAAPIPTTTALVGHSRVSLDGHSRVALDSHSPVALIGVEVIQKQVWKLIFQTWLPRSPSTVRDF